ncbi:hypothetical protein NPIL_678601 [Nephila pilipes]|uniref:Uncharacterized protein n=1 Tax=Nephila pilipes TaxID=299642 RepID=A0A8X6MA31_NEPPI|nr:hypothetical protein NPIL_678601 [Nephila pilipes]
MSDTSGAYEGLYDQLEQLIYIYTRQNTDSDLDLKLISKTQHIIIRCARTANKLLSAELKYYLHQIFENVRQQPTTTLPPPSQIRNNKKSKKNKRNLASSTLANKEQNK